MTVAFTRTRTQLASMVLRKLRVLDANGSAVSADLDIVYEAMDLRLKGMHKDGTFWRKVTSVPVTFSLTAGIATASAGAGDILFPSKVTFSNGTSDDPVYIIGKREYAEIIDKTRTGNPEKVLWKGGSEFIFYPVPLADGTAKILYEKIVDDTSAGSAPDIEVSMLRWMKDIITYDVADDFSQPEQRVLRFKVESEIADRNIRKLGVQRVDLMPVAVDDFDGRQPNSRRATDYLMPTERILLVGSLVNRNVDPGSSKDQRFTNCYPEVSKNPVTGKSRVYLNKRPGYAVSSVVQSGASAMQGVLVWTGKADGTSPVLFSFRKSSTTDMMVFNTAGSQIGGDIASTNRCSFLSETMISTTSNITGVFADSGTNALEAWFFPEGGAWTQITDGDFPTNITPDHVHMDGYMFVMGTDGKIWNSDLNSLSAWTATSFITAQSMPDGGVGLARYRNLIVAFGKYSTEFFYNAGNASGSPLSRVENALLRIGCRRTANVRSIIQIGNTVYFFGNNPDTGGQGIYRLNGFSAEKVSTPSIDRYIGMQTISGFSGTLSLHGMEHIIVNTNGETTYAFCIDTGMWWVMNSSDVVNAAISGYDFGTGAGIIKSFFTTGGAATIKTFDPTNPVYLDGAAAMTMTVQTENVDFGTSKMKFWEELQIVGDRQSSTSVLNVSYSDDDFNNYNTPRPIDLSTDNLGLERLGSSRKRSWKLTHAAATPCRLEAMDLTFSNE